MAAVYCVRDGGALLQLTAERSSVSVGCRTAQTSPQFTPAIDVRLVSNYIGRDPERILP